jgi:hypothetical protein
VEPKTTSSGTFGTVLRTFRLDEAGIGPFPPLGISRHDMFLLKISEGEMDSETEKYMSFAAKAGWIETVVTITRRPMLKVEDRFLSAAGFNVNLNA